MLARAADFRVGPRQLGDVVDYSWVSVDIVKADPHTVGHFDREEYDELMARRANLKTEKTKKFAIDFVYSVRSSVTDRNLKDSDRVAMRRKARKLLDRDDYPPDHEVRAFEPVLQKVALFASTEVDS